MYKYSILLVLLVLLTGCKIMSNTEVILAIKECEEARLKGRIVYSSWTQDAYKVVCRHANKEGT